MLPNLISRVKNAVTSRAAGESKPKVAPRLRSRGKQRETAERLIRCFQRYRTEHLTAISPEEFRRRIESRLGTVDPQAEGYAGHEVERQRDLSVKFHWGHNHDFGAFAVTGRMADRHIELLSNFVDLFPIELEDFNNKDAFDVGCWTGGTTLLLAALGSRVFAIEEVKRYGETAQFLADSFGLADRIAVEPQSLYSCNLPRFFERFDIAYFPGVIYHLSDPLIGLRILFNSLKAGGVILVESAGIDVDEPYCRFDGSLIHQSGSREEMNRGGWNWFWPSPSALGRMMREAGFDEVQTCWHPETHRVFGFGKKLAQVSICKAGLSVPDIR